MVFAGVYDENIKFNMTFRLKAQAWKTFDFDVSPETMCGIFRRLIVLRQSKMSITYNFLSSYFITITFTLTFPLLKQF